jgi:heat shock protein HslJ
LRIKEGKSLIFFNIINMEKSNLVISTLLVLLVVVLFWLVASRDDDREVSQNVIEIGQSTSVETESGLAIEQELPAVEPAPTAPAIDKKETTTPSPNKVVTKGDILSSTWVWQETIMNDDTRIVPRNPGAFSLTFDAEGRLSGSTDCNGFGGDYTITDGVLETGPFMMTMMYCEGSQEMDFQKMLSQPLNVWFDEAGELVLLLPYDSGSMIFKGEPRRF